VLPVFDRSAVANAAPAIIMRDGFEHTPDAVRSFSAKPPAGGRRLRVGNASRNREDSRHFGRTPTLPPISGRAAPHTQRHDLTNEGAGEYYYGGSAHTTARPQSF